MLLLHKITHSLKSSGFAQSFRFVSSFCLISQKHHLSKPEVVTTHSKLNENNINNFIISTASAEEFQSILSGLIETKK